MPLTDPHVAELLEGEQQPPGGRPGQPGGGRDLARASSPGRPGRSSPNDVEAARERLDEVGSVSATRHLRASEPGSPNIVPRASRVASDLYSVYWYGLSSTESLGRSGFIPRFQASSPMVDRR